MQKLDLEDLLTFYVATYNSAGVATNADSVPSFRIYEDESSALVVSGVMARLDSANVTAVYSEQQPLNASAGYEQDKDYAIVISAAVASNTGVTVQKFRINPFAGYVAKGYAQAGASNTITLTSATVGVSNAFNRHFLVLTAGPAAPQVRTVSGYLASSKLLTVDRAFDGSTPTASTRYAIVPYDLLGLSSNEVASAVWDALASAYTAASTMGEKQNSGLSIGASSINSATFSAGAITSAAYAAGAINSAVVADGTIDSATFAAGAISSAVLANGALVSATFAASAISSAVLANGALVSAKFAASAISSAVLADAAINSGKFAASALSSAALASGSVDAIWAKAMSDLASVPGATSSVLAGMNWVFQLARNRITQTSSAQVVFRDDGTTSAATAAVSDDGTTFIRGEFG